MCVLALLSVSADGAPFPLDPTIDLPQKLQFYEHQYAKPQSSNAYDERVISPVADAFVASKYPFSWEEFGQEEIVAVGRHEVLEELATFLTYTWSLPENFMYVSESTLLFGSGGGDEEAIEVDIKRTKSFDERAINNHTRPQVIANATSGEIGELGYWYVFDVSDVVYDAVEDRHWPGSISFGIYAVDPEFPVHKLSASREFDPALAPQLFVQHLVDYEAPILAFDAQEWMKWGVDQIILRIQDGPDPEYKITRTYTDVEREITTDQWTGVTRLNGMGDLTAELDVKATEDGFTRYRAKSHDHFGNSADYVYTEPIRIYTTDLTGWITDHRHHKLPVTDPAIEPEPWYIDYDDEEKSFSARLRNLSETIDPLVAGYGSWGATSVYDLDQNREEIYAPLPPVDNVMTEAGAADNLRNWELIGDGKLTVLQSNSVHGNSMRFVPDDENVSYICPKNIYSIESLNQPTLGLFYWTGYNTSSAQWLVWQHEDGSFERIHELMNTGYWTYTWTDYGTVRQHPGRPCFEYLPGNISYNQFFFDSISLGSTRSDFGLIISPPAQLPPPGEPYPIDLIVTNHSPYPATGMLYLTVEGESEPQSWLLPEIAPDETITRSVTLVSPAEEDTLWVRSTVGKAEIDDTPWRNIAEWMADSGRHARFPSPGAGQVECKALA